MEKILIYQVMTSWKEGRGGEIYSTVLGHTIEVATPPEFAKGVAGIWSPEHLFMAAISSCFMTNFLAMAEKKRLEFSHFECSATMILNRTQGKLTANKISLHPVVIVIDSINSIKGLKTLALTAKS